MCLKYNYSVQYCTWSFNLNWLQQLYQPPAEVLGVLQLSSSLYLLLHASPSFFLTTHNAEPKLQWCLWEQGAGGEGGGKA